MAQPQLSKILVIDVGGTHIKCFCGTAEEERFVSGPQMTAQQMVDGVLKIAGRRRFTAVSIGYPGAVKNGRPLREPVNLGTGWVDMDYEKALGAPVRMINDAALQALGTYRSGTMLFLGLGTGLGTAAVVDGTVLALEVAHLPFRKGGSYEHYVGALGLKRLGVRKWRLRAIEVVELLRKAFVADDLVLGGGNAFRVIDHVKDARLVGEMSAYEGGVRLWRGNKPSRGPAAGRSARRR
jgi:polyphosphate glucokinase